MNRRFAIGNSSEAAEELTSHHLPGTSLGEGQDFIEQTGTLVKVSRTFHVPVLVRKSSFFNYSLKID